MAIPGPFLWKANRVLNPVAFTPAQVAKLRASVPGFDTMGVASSMLLSYPPLRTHPISHRPVSPPACQKLSRCMRLFIFRTGSR